MIEDVTLTAVDGIRVGHARRDDRPTGCTVVLAPEGTTGGVDVRGAAPGTRETDLMRPDSTVQRVDAVVLAGGSAFGLAAATGVMDWLRERGVGYPTSAGPVPIVPAAILYDLGVGGGTTHPDAATGEAACAAASAEPVEEGSVGAGAGATVGKLFGREHAMKGGVGSAGFRFDDGTVVAALVAVNCRGDVRDPRTGRIVAGARAADGRTLRDAQAELLAGARSARPPEEIDNTTIGVIATNVELTQAECTHLASVAHDGLARSITPAHTRFDGDTLFFLSTGTAGRPDAPRDHDLVEIAAAAAVSRAVVDAVMEATGLREFPSVSDLAPDR